jgi:alkaline phosphatase
MINFVVDDSPVMNTGRTYSNDKWNELKLFDYKDTPNFWGEDYRPDFYTKKAVREYLQSNFPQFLWISLGDTDEAAHEGDYWGYLMSLQAADKFIGELIQGVESSFARDHTVVIVTTDHGRGLDWRNHGWDYESSRTWIMMHGTGIPHLGLVKLNKTVHPSNIYPTVIELKTGHSQRESLLNKRLYK